MSFLIFKWGRRCLPMVLALLFLTPPVDPALAGVAAMHDGANDPSSEGWTPTTFSNVTAGPLTPDAVGGLDAWFVDDNGTAIGDVGWYTQSVDSADVILGDTLGWNLSVRLRIADFPDPAPGAPALGFDASPFARYRNNSTLYSMFFGAQADGDPIVMLPTAFAPSPAGPQFVLEGGGPGYHLYELKFDPVAATADLFIDGIERVSNYGGASGSSTPSVTWGAGSSCCTGQGNYNHVSLTVVPEPAAAALGLLGLIGLSTNCRRRS